MSSAQPSSETASRGIFLPRWLMFILRLILIVALPLVLILFNARLMMTGAFLNWAYNSPFVPVDPFGFTTQDRLTYAPLALDYLFNDQGIDFLGSQILPEGRPLYNERELSHMHDVKNVTQMLTRFGVTLIGVYVLSVVLLAVAKGTRPDLFQALRWGAIVTIVAIIVSLVVTVTSFDWLFTMFHRLFFTGDTWIFPYSDTLIRLFPIEFWTEAFALMFGGALLEAALIGGGSWAWLRRNTAS
jgi:integral membrane protein (TIGR01906 family)